MKTKIKNKLGVVLDIDCKSYQPIDRSIYARPLTNLGSIWHLNGRMFDGIDDYIVAGTSVLTLSSTTISMWMKPSVSQTLPFFSIFVGNGYLVVYQYGTAPIDGIEIGFRTFARQQTPAGKLKINRWNHIVIVYNGGNKDSATSFNVYVNGYQTTLTSGSAIGGSFTQNNIGKDEIAAYFKGIMDEFRIYDRVLSTPTIYKLYQEGTKKRNQ